MELPQWIAAAAIVVALLVGVGTVTQRWYADRRTQWWSRTQWALDLSLEEDDDAKVELGFEVLVHLVNSKITTSEQATFIQVAADRILQGVGEGDNE